MRFRPEAHQLQVGVGSAGEQELSPKDLSNPYQRLPRWRTHPQYESIYVY